MELLTAIAPPFLAFALTLAALAIVVTIITETGKRAFRIRKMNLIKLMRFLNDELGKDGTLGLTDEERWKFLKDVVSNPAVRDSTADVAGLDGRSVDNAIASLGWVALGVGTYDWVSLEHFLRRLAETPKVEDRSRDARQMVTAELNRLARKFEEYKSAISAEFKQSAQTWSVVIGILLAIVANVHGLRIVNAYLADDKVTQAIISKQQDFERAIDEAQRRNDQLNQLAQNVNETANAFDADVDDNSAQRRAFDEAVAALTAETSQDAIEKSTERALAGVADLASPGIPIGWQFYPACPFGSRDEDVWHESGRECNAIAERYGECIFLRVVDTGPDCTAWHFLEESSRSALRRIVATATIDTMGFLNWLIVVVGTGLLIGLGAPFWFDVARRLAQVRQSFLGKASSDIRMSGQDADGDAASRKEIVDQVIGDAFTEASLRITQANIRGAQ